MDVIREVAVTPEEARRTELFEETARLANRVWELQRIVQNEGPVSKEAAIKWAGDIQALTDTLSVYRRKMGLYLLENLEEDK